MAVRFTRVLEKGDVGPDVEGVGRALSRGKFMGPLARFVQKPARVRRTWGVGKTVAVEKLQKRAGLPVTGRYGAKEHKALAPHFDAYAAWLMEQWQAPPALCFPIARGVDVHVGGLHETGGLPGNWAIDFICKAGSRILAPEAGTITRFSGHPPSDDTADSIGVFGWTTYLQTPAGYLYFITHQGSRRPTLKVGQHVGAGELLGYVGNQRYRPDHAHVGVTSPHGEADAKRHITAVSKAKRHP